MIESPNCARLAGTIFFGVVMAGVTGWPLQAAAHESRAATERTVTSAAIEATSNQIVVRDAATGAIRAATPAEANALRQSKDHSAELRRAPGTPMAKTHWTGARGARLTDDFMSYSVMVRQPDGSMAAVCFDSKEEADAAMKASAPIIKLNTAPTE